MVDYEWRCTACENTNAADAERCEYCDCPSEPNAVEIEAHAAKYKAIGPKDYCCSKCSSGEYDIGEIRASGGLLSSVLEVESEKFTFLACKKCGYTEFYRGERSALRSLLDWGI